MTLKVWTNVKFSGFWPVGTAAVIISETKEGAENALRRELETIKLTPNPGEVEAMELVPLAEGSVAILRDGNY